LIQLDAFVCFIINCVGDSSLPGLWSTYSKIIRSNHWHY